jgi:hypothetical protein
MRQPQVFPAGKPLIAIVVALGILCKGLFQFLGLEAKQERGTWFVVEDNSQVVDTDYVLASALISG